MFEKFVLLVQANMVVFTKDTDTYKWDIYNENTGKKYNLSEDGTPGGCAQIWPYSPSP